jgi:hypothetical protein
MPYAASAAIPDSGATAGVVRLALAAGTAPPIRY